MQVEKSVENLFLYLACLRAGLVYHPLNIAYKASELDYFLADAEPTIVVCDSAVLPLIKSLVPAGGVKSIADTQCRWYRYLDAARCRREY